MRNPRTSEPSKHLSQHLPWGLCDSGGPRTPANMVRNEPQSQDSQDNGVKGTLRNSPTFPVCGKIKSTSKIYWQNPATTEIKGPLVTIPVRI